MIDWIKRLLNFDRRPAAWDAVSLLAFSLMPNEVEQRALAEYLHDSPALYEKLRLHTYLLVQHDEEFVRWCLAGLFVNYATVLGDNRLYGEAKQSLVYAVHFFEDFPLAWACYAEAHLQLQNAIAARWARKLIYFKPTKSALEFYNRMLPDGAYEGMMKVLKEQMKSVIATCNAHPEWVDSYDFLRGIEYFQKTLGPYGRPK